MTLLLEVDKEFDSLRRTTPVHTSKDLAAVGYSGFRLGTQIDPFWNAYFLALVLTVAPEIESKRVGPNTAFAYRFAPANDGASLFSRHIGWREFQREAIDRAKTTPIVLRCDIADFYSRIYHHRLDNALRSATSNTLAAARIMDVVSAIADGPSYGLPVGGPAARILSELLLNRVDRLLVSESINFIRFVDDYIIFAQDRASAHSALITLSTFLLANEGLSLQKSKTRLMTSAEFLSTSEFSEADVDSEDSTEIEERTFRRLRLYFDPYSPSAQQDYENLISELSRFDIVGMLGRQLAKSRIDEPLTRRLIGAVKHLDPQSRKEAVLSMLRSIDLLYPIFPTVMTLIRALASDLPTSVQEAVFQTLRDLITNNSYVTQVPANLAFALRVLVADSSEETSIVLAQLYKRTTSMMIRRDLILILARRGADYWVSNIRKNFATATPWEKRALLIASYTLGDEGSHWRDAIKKDQSSFDQFMLRWTAASKSKKGQSWMIPI